MPSTVAPAFFSRSQNSAPLLGKCGEKKTKFMADTLSLKTPRCGCPSLAHLPQSRKWRRRESLGRESPGDRDAGQQPAAAVMHSHTGVSKNSHGCNRPATSAMKGVGVRSSHRGDSHEQDFA